MFPWAANAVDSESQCGTNRHDWTDTLVAWQSTHLEMAKVSMDSSEAHAGIG